jgi:hypothetical protein
VRLFRTVHSSNIGDPQQSIAANVRQRTEPCVAFAYAGDLLSAISQVEPVCSRMARSCPCPGFIGSKRHRLFFDLGALCSFMGEWDFLLMYLQDFQEAMRNMSE